MSKPLTNQQMQFINMLQVVLVRLKISKRALSLDMGFFELAVSGWFKNGGGSRINTKTKERIRAYAEKHNFTELVPYHIQHDHLCSKCNKAMEWRKSCVCHKCDGKRYTQKLKKEVVATAAELRREEVKKIMAVPVRPVTTWVYWFGLEQGKRYV